MLQPAGQSARVLGIVGQAKNHAASVRVRYAERAFASNGEANGSAFGSLLRYACKVRGVLHRESEVRNRSCFAFADDHLPAAAGDPPATVGQRRDAVAEQLAVEAREALGVRAVAPQMVQARRPEIGIHRCHFRAKRAPRAGCARGADRAPRPRACGRASCGCSRRTDRARRFPAPPAARGRAGRARRRRRGGAGSAMKASARTMRPPRSRTGISRGA